MIKQKRTARKTPNFTEERITLSIGADLKREVFRLARERGNSVSGLVRALLKKWIKSGKI